MDGYKNAQDEWELVADTAPQFFCLLDRRGKVVSSNRALEHWGLGSAAATRGRTLHEVVHAGCTAADCRLLEFERLLVSALEDGLRPRLEGFDPQLERRVAIRALPVGHGGEPGREDILAVVSVADADALPHPTGDVVCLETALRRCFTPETAGCPGIEDSQCRLLALLGRTPAFVAMADADGHLFYLNQTGRDLLGLADADAVGMAVADCLDAESAALLATDTLPAALGRGTANVDSRLRGRDGREVPVSMVVVGHRAADGRPLGYSLVAQDLTARLEAEAALGRAEANLRQVSARLLDVQENERRRIAADLHDVVGQSLSLIKLSLDQTQRLVAAGDTTAATRSLQRVGGKVKEALAEVQRVSMDLRPAILDDLGILATLSWFFREFEESCGHIRVVKDLRVEESQVPPPIKTQIFRILQEATANVVKHAGANEIRVALRQDDDRLELTFEDNGQGYDPAQPCGQRAGFGLQSMRERVTLSGGRCRMESAIGKGTRIHAAWPAATAR